MPSIFCFKHTSPPAQMATWCVDVAKVFGDVMRSISTDPTKLPIDATENVVTNLTPGVSTDSLECDKVSAPPSIDASEVALAPVEVRVFSGTPAVFVLANSRETQQHEFVLTTLASGAEVIAIMRSVSNLDGGVIDVQVAVDIQAAVTLNCLFLTVAVPPGTPDGSCVMIHAVWVAGVSVVLNELASSVTIGFNHAPAPAGAVIDAAVANDLSRLKQALGNGESTEEKDRVSATGRLGYRGVMGFVCRRVRGAVVGMLVSPLPLRVHK